MDNITFDFSRSGVERDFLLGYQERITQAHEWLHSDTEELRQFVGWINPGRNQEYVGNIAEAAMKIRQNSKVLIVIGIGGSYLGAKTVIEAVSSNFYNSFAINNNSLEIYFAGTNLSPNYIFDLLQIIKNKDFSLVVISKSGTTLEPALAFHFLKKALVERYGDNARERIFVITDQEKGVLHEMAQREGLTCFPVPQDVGGRYSVVTPVGLLPIAAAGLDINEFLKGASDGQIEMQNLNIDQNIAYQYAVLRNILYERGKTIEILANYEPKLHYLGEWWKQLFGESEGKNGKGLFPAATDFTTDLHSMGQYIQEGPRNMFETVINIDLSYRNVTIEEDSNDGLSYLLNKDVDHINKQAMAGTLMAHSDGGVPNLVFNLPSLSLYWLGKMMYLFEVACATSGHLLGVNPFDQPGVEAYKKNMTGLLNLPASQ